MASQKLMRRASVAFDFAGLHFERPLPHSPPMAGCLTSSLEACFIVDSIGSLSAMALLVHHCGSLHAQFDARVTAPQGAH